MSDSTKTFPTFKKWINLAPGEFVILTCTQCGAQLYCRGKEIPSAERVKVGGEECKFCGKGIMDLPRKSDSPTHQGIPLKELEYIFNAFDGFTQGKPTSLGVDIAMALLKRKLGKEMRDDEPALLCRHWNSLS